MNDEIFLIEDIKRKITPIAQKYGVNRVFLFGSYARGEADGNSDIDFIIEKGKLRGLQFAGMLGDLQDNFNKSVDLLTTSGVEENSINYNFKDKIKNDMVVVYEKQ